MRTTGNHDILRHRLGTMIRIAVLDRHPAVRAGVEATITSQHGLASVGAAGDRRELWAVLYRARPDVVLLEHHSVASEALGVCLRIRAGVPAPRVVLCTTGADDGLTVPATLAGADAIVDTAANLHALVHAIRVVARGGRVMPAVTPRLQARAAARLGPHHRAIFAMRLAGTPSSEIAATVGLTPRRLADRVQAIVATLGARDGAARPLSGAAPDIGLPPSGEAA
jgi:DNA-binding NarL/FixJ family response regulator